jgi:16S rRNA processing protein RimM
LNIIGDPLDANNMDKVRVFYVIQLHGLKGEVKVLTDIPDLSKILKIKTLFDEEGQKYDVCIKKIHNDVLLLKIHGVDSREEAAALKCTQFYLNSEDLCKCLDFDDIKLCTFFVKDFLVYSNEEEQIGNVHDTHNFGAGEVLEIFCNAKQSTFFYPFNKLFINEVNFLKQSIAISKDYIDFI